MLFYTVYRSFDMVCSNLLLQDADKTDNIFQRDIIQINRAIISDDYPEEEELKKAIRDELEHGLFEILRNRYIDSVM